MKHYTNIEQSKRLVELGLNIGTADMYYVSEDYSTPRIGVPLGLSPNVPCWSLEALLEAIPQSIQKWDDRSRSRKNYELNLFRSYYHCCSYSFGPSLKEENHDSLCCFGEDTWLDAVYKVAVWLAEKGWLTCKREKGNWVMV